MRRRGFLTGALGGGGLGIAAALGGAAHRCSSVFSRYLNADVRPRPLSSVDGVSRERTGRRYVLTYEWTDRLNRAWRTEFSLPQAAYAEAVREPHGYLGAFEAAKANPHAERLTGRIAASNPFDGRRGAAFSESTRLERAVGFVRSLAYATDSSSKGVPDYVRTVEETLVDGGGDCEDFAYLLVGMLSQPPFGYRTATVFLPGHMLVGVHSADLPAKYADARTLPGGTYVAIESVRSRPVGLFEDKPVLAIYGDGIEYVDPQAIAETTGDVLRDPSEFQTLADFRSQALG